MARFPSPIHVDTVFGVLTLGDGGSLTLGFAPITLSGTEALFIGELGTEVGELVGANVLVSPIPEPVPLALWCIGLAGLGLLGGRLHRRH
jgi:hypothetical protein